MIVRKFQVLITCPDGSMPFDDAVSLAENEIETIENEMLFQGQEMLGQSALPKGWEISFQDYGWGDE